MTLLFLIATLGLDPVNEKVVEFARSRMGQQVGDGVCATLAVEALRHADAAPRGEGHLWGEELPAVRQAQPGDILQFDNAVFVRRRLREDGALVTLQFTFPHHIAIVSAIRKRGKHVVLTILHQNADVPGVDEAERKLVQEWTIDLAEMKRGTLKAYRPVPK